MIRIRINYIFLQILNSPAGHINNITINENNLAAKGVKNLLVY